MGTLERLLSKEGPHLGPFCLYNILEIITFRPISTHILDEYIVTLQDKHFTSTWPILFSCCENLWVISGYQYSRLSACLLLIQVQRL